MMSKFKLILLPLCAVAFIALSYVIVTQARFASRPDPANQPSADTAIAFWEKRVAQTPNAYIDYIYLGEAYARKARETGAVDYYLRAEAALRKALGINPNYPPASSSLSNVLFAMHDFKGALALAEPLASVPKTAPSAWATIGDAQLALGDYAEAEAAYQQLAAINPGPSTTSRLAFLADLNGDTAEALSLMEQAADRAWQSGDYRENLAWYEYQVGEFNFKMGQLREAESHYQASFEVFDNYYLALAGLGKVRAAQGRYEAAIRFYEQAIAVVPQPDFLAALGDLYALTGKPDDAQRQYDTIEFIGKLAEINQQVYNRQLALFYADHDLQLPKALTLTVTELETRQDIFGYDAAAWAYYKNGQYEKAQAMMEQAMKLGTRDAKLYYHAGMIAQALGQTAEAEQLLSESLSINPHFDLRQAQIAQTTLDQLHAASN